MQILAHRGHWLAPGEKNSREVLNRAFLAGFGVETDVRDYGGTLVISHDMPGHDALTLKEVLQDYVHAGKPGMLALNIKSDGLTDALQHQLMLNGITRYFCFDMSIPDTLPYLHRGMSVAARISEYEPEGMLCELAPALWIDGFKHLNVSAEQLKNWLSKGKQVCLVSPELHGRDHVPLWQQLASLPDEIRTHQSLMLCTDKPELAREYLA